MVGSRIILFSLSLLIYFVDIEAQRCTPGVVRNITFSSANRLQWAAAVNASSCPANAYIINVFDLEESTQFQYQINPSPLYFDVPYLDMCKSYTFEVHALSDQNVYGPSDKLNATSAPTANANLTLSFQNVTLNNSQLSLTWSSNTAVSRCISYYRVVYWDENNSPTDIYVYDNNFTLKQNLVACMQYKFQVSAIIANPDIEGPVVETNYTGPPGVPSVPKLVNIVTSNSTANMTWKVPTYSENRCQLLALVVVTLGVPARNSSTTISIQDSALRPNVGVYLSGLTKNTVYTSYVSLQNSAGRSSNVTATYQTSELFVFDYERDLYYEDFDNYE